MQKRFRILSILLALSIILSPISLAFSNFTNAEEDNIGIVKELEQIEELQSTEETPFEFDEETGTITGYKDGNPPVDLVIPAEINGVKVKHIGKEAFKGKGLNSVTLPEGLESLGYMAFQKNNLTEIELPSTLTTLGQRSLAYNKLTTIEFPEGIKSIGKEAFQENEFTEIEIPYHIEEIEEGAFKTNKIENVVLHDGLKTIGAKAFEDNLIEEIEIPDTVVNWPSTNKDNPIFRRNGNGTGTLYLAKVYNNSGATPKNTFGVVNPASVTIEYKDSNGEEIKPSKTIVGKELKVAEKEGSAWNAPIVAVEGSGKDLLNYDAEFGYKLIEVIDEISENYYQMNKEYTFEPEEIEEYITPEAQTVTLTERENTITFTYTKEGQEPGEDLTKPASIELSFPGEKQVTPLYPGGKQIINVKVLNGKGEEIKGEEVTFESSNPDALKHSFLDTFTAGEVEEETEVTITAILKSNPEITGEIKVIVSPKKKEVVDLDEEIDFLKQCYEAYMTEDSDGNTGSAGLSMLAPGAARLAGMDVDKIQKHLYIDEDNKSAYQLSQSIITLIGADLDPRQYEDKGKVRNLVKELVDSQQDDGENKGEFIKADSDKNSIESLARSIIALDMAGAKYDEESAVSKLIEIYDKKNSHTYKDIKTEGIVLVALSNHKDIDGVESKVTEILNYLKTKQNEDGGFDIKSGFEKGTNSPTATGRVIQGLIANGINPLEDEEWIRDDSTMLDAIVKSKIVKDNMKHSGYGKGEEDKYTYYEATYTAFGALMDLKNQKSMFELLRLEVDTDAKPERVEITKPDKDKLEVEESIALTAKVYDKDGKVLQGQDLIWTSSNEDIATVKDGNVEAKSVGEATITVKVKDTEIQDSLKITVIEEVKTLEVNTAIIVFNEDGNYEIQSKPQKVIIDKDKHDGGFTVFGALQATTSEYEEKKGFVTSIYGITGPSTGGWMFDVNGKIPTVGARDAKLKEGDKVIWFCTYDWMRDKAPKWEELIAEEPKEKLTIKITTNKQSIKVGEELPLTAEVRQGDQVLTDKEIQWISSNAEIATIDENNRLVARKAGQVAITAALVEDKNIKDTIKIEVVEKDKEDLTIEEVIESLRGYYSNKDEFTFREALGYNYTSDNLEKDLVEISSKFKTNEDPKSASEHVGNIIGLIASGKDPYNHNSKNYVEPLVKSQNEEGKFIIGQYDDYSTTVAFSVLALDMVDAEYNREKAIEALLSYQGEDGSFGGIDETGMVLTAIAKYKDKSKVQEAISKGLKYLKEQQDENTGGFIVWGGENPYSAAAVIQGLIAVGEDPQSEKWSKGGKTIVDSLMNFYKDGHFEKESEWSDEPDIDMVTEQAFIALADVYRGESMFNKIKLNTNEVVRITIDMPEIDKIIEGETIKLNVTGYDSKDNIVPVKEIEWTSSDDKIAEVDKNGKVTTKKPGKVTITAKVKGTDIKNSIELEISEKEFEIEYVGDTEVKNGQQANARVRLRNLTEEKRSATLIVVLYDKKTNKLLNYSIIKKELESKEELELAAGFLIPETGDYYIKAFLWDDLEEQNIIMQEAKKIKVAN